MRKTSQLLVCNVGTSTAICPQVFFATTSLGINSCFVGALYPLRAQFYALYLFYFQSVKPIVLPIINNPNNNHNKRIK